MYKEDVEIAKHIAKIQERINWPDEIITSTGKANLQRILEVAKILNGKMYLPRNGLQRESHN
jgi:hypothetical protein